MTTMLECFRKLFLYGLLAPPTSQLLPPANTPAGACACVRAQACYHPHWCGLHMHCLLSCPTNSMAT